MGKNGSAFLKQLKPNTKLFKNTATSKFFFFKFHLYTVESIYRNVMFVPRQTDK